MKKITSVLVSLPLLFAFAGCGSTQEAAPPTKAVTKTAPKTAPTESKEDVFFNAAVGEYPELSSARVELIGLAHSICTSLDVGVSLTSIVLTVNDSMENPEMVGFLVADSVSTFCPKYTAEVNSFADQPS